MNFSFLDWKFSDKNFLHEKTIGVMKTRDYAKNPDCD